MCREKRLNKGISFGRTRPEFEEKSLQNSTEEN